MSWFSEAVPTVRLLIFDLDVEPQFDDSRLKEVLVVAARLVLQEIDFATTYVVSVKNISVTPDPLANNDDAFINFCILKAACLCDQGQFRCRAALEGLRANCGPTGLAIGGHLKGFETILEQGPCKTYTELMNQAAFSGANVARGIFPPFVSNVFDPRNLAYLGGYNSLHRSRMT